jgi:polysaccharide export outer membrane protein
MVDEKPRKQVFSMRLIRTSLLCVIVVFAACVSHAQTPEYVIGRGDQLLITVWGYDEFTTTATVKENGTVTINLVGEIEAAGLRRDEFISRLRMKLSEYIQGDVRITVSVLASVTQRVTVLGAVLRPDNYPIATEMSLLEAISMAGGYAGDANIMRIRIFHKDQRPPSEVDLDYYIERADLENIPKVRPGDVVFVPRQQNFIKDFGEYFAYFALFITLFRLTEGGTP